MRLFHAALRAATLFAAFALTAGPPCLLASRACAQGDLLPLPAEKPIRGALFPTPFFVEERRNIRVAIAARSHHSSSRQFPMGEGS